MIALDVIHCYVSKEKEKRFNVSNSLGRETFVLNRYAFLCILFQTYAIRYATISRTFCVSAELFCILAEVDAKWGRKMKRRV